jgi:hypothetical protein
MNKTGRKSAKHLFFFSIMLFTFSWVVIGDLVSFHIELIYGDKLHGLHQPFTKTQKDSSQTFKVKEKVKDNSSHSKVLPDSFGQELKTNVCSHATKLYVIQKILRSVSFTETVLLRGPPVTA